MAPRIVRPDAGGLAPGTGVGAYRILAELGRGGMGVVYRAHDPRLQRDVALKLLSNEDARDPIRLRRFEQEARAASALVHPTIVAVHEIGEASLGGGERPVPYIAMELVAGKPLASVLRQGPLPLRRCLELAGLLAEGLACAHEAGIVHRDLKPSNIMVTEDGRAKILDFGLAKLARPPAESGDLSDPTLTTAGAVLGTVGYMSPEQVRGEPLTPASDQFSFGCVVYEMLTGERAFKRPSPAETLSAVLRDTPLPLDEVAPSTPPPLRWLIERCLAKDPRERYASTQDLARELQGLRARLSDPALRTPLSPLPRMPRRLWPRIAALLIAAAAIAGGVIFLLPSGGAPEIEFRPLTFRRGSVFRALYSPGSNAVLYTASWDGSAVRTFQTLPESAGVDRSLDAETQFPLAYSADGSRLLVLLGALDDATVLRGTLAWWPALGGKPREVLADAGWADAAPQAGLLAVVKDSGAERVLELRDAEGGLVRPLFRTPGALAFVRFSPDERQVAFIHYSSLVGAAGEVWLAALDGSPPRALTDRFDVCHGLDWNHATREIWFTGAKSGSWATDLWRVSASGRLRLAHALPGYYVLQAIAARGDRCLLVEVDDTAELIVRRRGAAPEARSWFDWTVVTDLSTDGRRVLFFEGGASPGSFGTWVRDVTGGDAVRLTEGVPSRFSPDGKSIVTVIEPSGEPPQLAIVPVGPGSRRMLTASKASHSSPSFAGPGTILFVRSLGGATEVWRIGSDGSGAGKLGAPACDLPEGNPSGSAFVCVGSEGRALFIYPMSGETGRKLLERPSARFQYARWSARGDRIYAVTADRRLLTVDAATGSLVAEEELPLPGIRAQDLIGAALSDDASLQAYSIVRRSSSLHEAAGFR